MSRKPRPAAPGIPAAADTEAMIRVDHAGEFGAVRIYAGQLAVLQRRRSARNATAAVRKMAEQEQRHLERFEALINARKVRPTALEPLWHAAGFALGAGTALMGEHAAMACTAAVEEVIDQHYGAQLARLRHDDELAGTIAEFRADEIAHRQEALERGAEQAHGYAALSAAIRAGCRLAIALSERL